MWMNFLSFEVLHWFLVFKFFERQPDVVCYVILLKRGVIGSDQVIWGRVHQNRRWFEGQAYWCLQVLHLVSFLIWLETGAIESRRCFCNWFCLQQLALLSDATHGPGDLVTISITASPFLTNYFKTSPIEILLWLLFSLGVNRQQRGHNNCIFVIGVKRRVTVKMAKSQCWLGWMKEFLFCYRVWFTCQIGWLCTIFGRYIIVWHHFWCIVVEVEVSAWNMGQYIWESRQLILFLVSRIEQVLFSSYSLLYCFFQFSG